MVSHSRMQPGSPTRPIDTLMSPINRFLSEEPAGGILLLAATVIALAWANSPWGDTYEDFWHTYVSVSYGDYKLKMSLAHFVNDGLMAVFFFVVGLEIKRELLVGELASVRKAAIPIAAAIGGMAAPALVYVLFNLDAGPDSLRGWAIPTATDIAFVVGVMAMLGRRVPLSLKVFVTALAIVDDIGAVLVIALFYTERLSLVAFGVANGFLALSIIANVLHVRTPIVYGIIGLFLWLFLLQSGVHATVGGVLMALTIPSRMRIDGARFLDFSREALNEFEDAGGRSEHIMTSRRRQESVQGLEDACEHVLTPLSRLEHMLHPWVIFLVMPIFALANAGVILGADAVDALGSGVGLGVAVGLFVGKPLGVVAATWIAIKLGVGELPTGSNWRQLLGAGCLAGIGFTMSLFIANLAFGDAPELQFAKMGILGGSLIAGVVGFILLRTASGPRERAGQPSEDTATTFGA